MKRIRTLLLGLPLYSLLSLCCEATDHNSNGSAESVQALQNIASDGDTIMLPAGTFVWTHVVRITKNITLRGASRDLTVISGNDITLLNLGTSSSTVAGIHFILHGGASSGGNMIVAKGQNFRIHDNKFENGGPYHIQIGVLCKGSVTIPHPTGVIDHNQFLNCKFLIQGNNPSYWHEHSKIGNPDQTGVVYLEDNYFHENTAGGGFDAADSDTAGRYVFRYNEVHNCQVEVHSARGVRGGRSCEIYNNTFIRDIAGDQFAAIWPRAGTGVIYNNTITGAIDSPVTLDNMRSYQRFNFPTGGCDGTSDRDGNQTLGWPCRDQIGRGADQYLWTIPPYPSQLSEPLYIWNNTHNGSPAPVRVANNGDAVKPGGSSADIQSGRDYVLSARPDYMPYRYPHPLTITKGRAAIADFNEDGSPDLVLQKLSTKQTAICYLDNNVPIGAAFSAPVLPGWALAGLADFNEDTHPDYALFSASTGATAIWYLSGPNYIGGGFGPTLPHGWDFTAAADFNGDGHGDYVLCKTSTRQTVIAYLHNRDVIGAGFGPTLPGGWGLIGVADFNRDGHPDYLTWNVMTGETVIVYLSDRTLLGEAPGPTIPPGCTLVGTGDFDRDGSPDFLLYRVNTGQTAIWYVHDNVYVSSAVGPVIPAGWTLFVP